MWVHQIAPCMNARLLKPNNSVCFGNHAIDVRIPGEVMTQRKPRSLNSETISKDKSYITEGLLPRVVSSWINAAF